MFNSRNKLANIFLDRVQRIPRSASNYQRPRLKPLPVPQMNSLKADFLDSCKNMTTEKWKHLRENLIATNKQLNSNNIDATILGFLNEAHHLQTAKKYVNFLGKCGVEPNNATLGRLLRVYNLAYNELGVLTEKEETEIIEICKKLRASRDLLDSITCEYLIYGLVSTRQHWRDSLELLEMMKLTALPNISVYTEIIKKSFLARDGELAWRLLEELAQQNKQPRCEIYLTFLDIISKNVQCFNEEFPRLLKFIQKYELLLTSKVSDMIETVAKISELTLHAEKAEISKNGKCGNCGKHLRNIAVGEKEYKILQDSFLQKVLIRGDVFQKTSPEEVHRFKKFVDETVPYDCVVDGLNVAYSKGTKKSPKEMADLLTAVVRYFNKRGKSVLVLGRQHMDKWPRESMKYIKQHANVFLTNDLTHDDPFMLYATLKSGQTTDFFSRDLMRSHAFLLGPELKSVFRRWQQEHQYSLITQTNSGKIIVKEPIRFLTSAHQVNDTWHLPLIPEYISNIPETFDVPESWLCLKCNYVTK